MVYIRGNAFDYDQWAEFGATGWSYADVLPYFRRSEGNERGGVDFHGGDGPIHVMDQRWPNVPSRRLVDSAASHSDARRVGQAVVGTGRSRLSPIHYQIIITL